MANELAKYRASTVQAEETLYFLEVSNAYHMLFLRAEAATVDTGAETEEIPDVTQATQAEEISKYKPSMTLSSVFLKEDPCCKAILDIWDKRATGADTHFNLLEVRTWDDNKAIKNDVSISVSSITAEAGSKIKIEATLNFTSDPVDVGTAIINGETGVATIDEKP